jgi:hypothetical protein
MKASRIIILLLLLAVTIGWYLACSYIRHRAHQPHSTSRYLPKVTSQNSPVIVASASGASAGRPQVSRSADRRVDPQSAILNPQSDHSEFRIPHSINPQSEIRNPQLDQSEIRNPQSLGLPLFFEPNRGQAEDSIKFMSGGTGLRLSFTRDALIFASGSSASQQPPVAMHFVGSNPNSKLVGEGPLPGRSNYLIGNDPSQWKTDLPQYAKVRYKQIYPGIDLIFYGNQQQLEYDLVVSPGVDPSVIKFAYDVDSPQRRGERGGYTERKGSAKTLRALRLGGDKDLSLKIDAHEDLVINTAAGEIRQLKPKIYQEINGVKFPVPGRYVLKSVASSQLPIASGELSAVSLQQVSGLSNHRLSSSTFRIPNSAFRIGESRNPKSAIRNRNISHSEFHIPHSNRHPSPDTQHLLVAFQIDSYDLAKPLVIDPQITYTFNIENNGFNSPRSIAVDASGNTYIAGSTNATNFKLVNPLQSNYGGNNDAYVIKVNPQGTAITYATYLGGSESDTARAVAVDSTGNIYLAGSTASSNFPTQNALQTASGGRVDVFVAKLNASGNALIYSTYLGGSGTDSASGLAVDAQGNVYIGGTTSSTNFPVKGGFQMQLGGGQGQDAFIAKINASGSALVYASYLGGSNFEAGQAIAIDSSGSAYVTGSTGSSNFPTLNAFQPTLRGATNAFVTKVNTSGNALVYSSFYGGNNSEIANSVAVDPSGNAYIVGQARSRDLPTKNPFQAALSGPTDAFVAKINAAGSTLVYSSYLGGSKDEEANGIAVDGTGRAYIVGQTASTDFPLKNPIQASYGGGEFDPFMIQLSAEGALEFSTYLGDSTLDFANAIALRPRAQRKGGPTNIGMREQDIFEAADAVYMLIGFENPNGTQIRLYCVSLFQVMEFDVSLFPLDFEPQSVSLGRLNNDAFADIAVTGAGNSVETILSNATGTNWTPGPSVKMPASVIPGPRAVTIANSNLPPAADIDTDNDVFAATSSGVFIFENQGDGTLAPGNAPGNGLLPSVVAGTTPVGVFVIDVNQDNIPDVVAVNRGSGGVSGNVTFYLGDTGSLGLKEKAKLSSTSPVKRVYKAPIVIPLENNPLGAAVGDFDGSGKPNLAITWSSSGSLIADRATIYVARLFEPFLIALRFFFPELDNFWSQITDMIAVDTNGDGKDEGIVVDSVLNDLSRVFVIAKAYSAGRGAIAAAAGDFNGDGIPDLAVANAVSNDVSILRGDGKGGFLQPINFKVGQNPISIAVGDMNGDGKDDLVVANHDSKSVMILTNKSVFPESTAGYFSQFGDGQGISSRITLVNPSTTRRATGKLALYSSAGNPASVAHIRDGRAYFGIAPRGLRSFATAGTGKPLVGSAQFVSNLPVAATVLFSGSIGVAGVPAVTPLSRFVVPIESDLARSVQTGVAISNPGVAKLDVTIRLRDANGLAVAEGTTVVTLAGKGQLARFPEELFAGKNINFAKFQGTVEITSSQPINAMAIRVSPGQFATLPVTGAGAKRLLFAQFGEVNGISSTLTFVNPSTDKAASVTVKIYDDNGQPLTVNLNGTDRNGQFTFNIPPLGVVSFSSPGTSMATKVGSVVVDSTENIGGTILFGGSFGLAGVGASQALANFIAPVEQTTQGGVTVGLALMNTGTTQVTVKLTLRDESGTPIDGGTTNVTLPSQAHVAKFVGQFFPNLSLADFRGTITGEATGGQIGATVIRQSGAPLEFATLPVAEIIP